MEVRMEPKTEVRMLTREIDLFMAFVKNANRYVEFGCGGSTLIAANNVSKSVVSVDSSLDWITRVSDQCKETKIEPELAYVDIGDVGEWGTPLNEDKKELWPNYYSSLWAIKDTWDADLFFIDGRFRVACFASICFHCRSPIIGFHDFASRQDHYGEILQIGRVIASSGNLSFFMPIPNTQSKAYKLLELHRFDYK